MAECLEATNGGAFFLFYLTPKIKAGIWFRSNSRADRRIRKCLLTKKEDLLACLFETIIKMTAGNTVIMSNRLRNISLGGAFVFTSGTSLPESTSCVLEIDLIGRASLLRIQVEAEVVRADEDGMAVKFTRIDLDSLVHLRHLIAVHAQDPKVVDVEYDKGLLELNRD